MIKESPVSIECRVREVQEYGSHSVFTADVLAVHVDDQYMDEKGKFDLAMSNPIVYSHGEYYGLGKKLGTFGYSIKKKRKKKQMCIRDRIKSYENMTGEEVKEENVETATNELVITGQIAEDVGSQEKASSSSEQLKER